MSHMKARIKLTINGRVCSGRAGQTILEVAQNNGIEIPNLCHNSELKHYGGCSLCVVEAENSPKLLRAAPRKPRTVRSSTPSLSALSAPGRPASSCS